MFYFLRFLLSFSASVSRWLVGQLPRLRMQCFQGILGGFLLVFAVAIGNAQEFTPEHEVVQDMVKRGVKYLVATTNSHSELGQSYRMLVAYTILKATEDHDHPMVKKEIQNAIRFANDARNGAAKVTKLHEGNYDASVVTMFLAAHDPVAHRKSLEDLRDFLVARQHDDGAFNYPTENKSLEGDTSQSQYVALALWSLKQVDIKIEPIVFEKLTKWFIKAQGNTGGWIYHFPDPNSTPTYSMLAAGLSGTLASADAIGLLRGPGAALAQSVDEDDDVPKAFRRIAIEKKVNSRNEAQISVPRSSIERTVRGAELWISKNAFSRNDIPWYYYCLYGRERYESFLELFRGTREKSPAWYNTLVRSLRASQDESGGWGINKDRPDPIGEGYTATSFAILFLLRNTQKSIGDLKIADSVGGSGLSGLNVADVAFVDGKVVDKSQVTSIEDAMKLLESEQENSPQDQLLADRMKLDADPVKRKEQLYRFARLLRSPDTRARRIAAKLLGRGDDLDFVPDLIFALSEGEKDGQVLRLAENSLRILSRQLTTYILPREGIVTAADRVKAERYWQSWFLSIRPDYVFIE